MDPNEILSNLDAEINRYICVNKGAMQRFLDLTEEKLGAERFVTLKRMWLMSWEEIGLGRANNATLTMNNADGSHYFIWHDPILTKPWDFEALAIAYVYTFLGGSAMYIPVKGGLVCLSRNYSDYDNFLMSTSIKKCIFKCTEAHDEVKESDQLRLAAKAVHIKFPKFLELNKFLHIACSLAIHWIKPDGLNCFIGPQTGRDPEFVPLVSTQKVSIVQPPVAQVVDFKLKGKCTTDFLTHDSSTVLEMIDEKVEPEEMNTFPEAEFFDIQVDAKLPERLFGLTQFRHGEHTVVSLHQMFFGPAIGLKGIINSDSIMEKPGACVAKFIGSGQCSSKLIDIANRYVSDSFRCSQVHDEITIKRRTLSTVLPRGVGAVEIGGSNCLVLSETLSAIQLSLSRSQRALFDVALKYGRVEPRMLGAGAILITGHSGIGKSTVAALLSKALRWVHIDLDRYYRPKDKMPTCVLSNGKKVTNWDHMECFDWTALREDLESCSTGFVLSGIHVPKWVLPKDTPVINIELTQYGDGLSLDPALIALRRMKTKGWNQQKFVEDELYVREILIPAYEDMRKERQINYFVPCYDKGMGSADLIFRKCLSLAVGKFSIFTAVLDFMPREDSSCVCYAEEFLGRTYMPYGPGMSFTLKQKIKLGFSRKKDVAEITDVRYYKVRVKNPKVSLRVKGPTYPGMRLKDPP